MEIKIIRSNRKTLSLSVDDELNALVRAPFYVSSERINAFVSSNAKWLEHAVKRKETQLEKYNLTDVQVNDLIIRAKEIIPERVDYYAQIMDLKPTGVKISKAKKRFGSCSNKNSLCFSCYLMLYPI